MVRSYVFQDGAKTLFSNGINYPFPQLVGPRHSALPSRCSAIPFGALWIDPVLTEKRPEKRPRGPAGADPVVEKKSRLGPLFQELPGTLKLTAKAPENGWLYGWNTSFLFGARPIFRGYVSFRELMA